MSLKDLNWTYEGPVSIMVGKGYQGKGISRTMFLSPNLADIPAELFAVKISQSPNAMKTGKVVYKFFSFRFDSESGFMDFAPEGCTPQTPVEEIKNITLSKLSNVSGAEASIRVGLHGSFTNIETADGTYAIFDTEKFADAETPGVAPYYINKDAIITVKVKGAVSQGNEYLQSTLSTTATADEIFVTRQAGKVYDPTGASTTASTPASTPSVPNDGGQPVW